MKKKKLLVSLALWLSVALACNFPGLKRPAHELTVQELRQTLQARGTHTAVAIIPPGETPAAPGSPFPGSNTATPTMIFEATLPAQATDDPAYYHYVARSGDTLTALAGRFGVQPVEIISSQALPASSFLQVGQMLAIPKVLGETPYSGAVLPDSEIVNAPTSIGFDIAIYIQQAGGYLSAYSELVKDEQLSGAEIIERVALESSVNPRFLLALLEYRSGWVLGQPVDANAVKYPVGFHIPEWSGLYKELVMTSTHLNAGYYGWRVGSLTQLEFQDGRKTRIDPQLNAGSVAVEYLLAKLRPQAGFQDDIYGPSGFLVIYQQMFGDAWARAATAGPIFPPGLEQPQLELPIAPGERWSLTGGPHPSWKTGSPRGALDLAPVTGEMKCAVSYAWVRAMAPGLITRSERNVVTIDLDGDGYEQTGWVVFYMHIADKDRIQAGVWVKTDDLIGHPSCEGGSSTGTHVHIARKYNGEWLAADGPLPFTLGGWVVRAGDKNYQGELRKGEQVVMASPVGPRTSIIVR